MLVESEVSHFEMKCQQIQLKVMEFKVSISGSYGTRRFSIVEFGVLRCAYAGLWFRVLKTKIKKYQPDSRIHLKPQACVCGSVVCGIEISLIGR